MWRDRAHREPCRPAARKALNKRLARQRWDSLDVHARNDTLGARTAHDAPHQQRPRDAALKHGRRWTEEEIASLITHVAEAEHRLAIALGRSPYAVRVRKRILRRRGLLSALRRPSKAMIRLMLAAWPDNGFADTLGTERAVAGEDQVQEGAG